MSDVKGVIFDKDGTLFDFGATWEAWATAFLLRLCDGDRGRAAEVGQAIEFDFEAQKFAKTSIAIAGTNAELTEALHPFCHDLKKDALMALLNEEAASAPQHQAVPLLPLLKGLRSSGLRLGVATNDAEHPARAHLDQAGVTQMFDFIAGYDSGYGGKPAPGQLLAFAKQNGLEAAHCVMVGDSTHDLRAGRAAGMQTVAVLTGMADAATLAPHADVVLPDIGHLPVWLAR